MRVVSILILLCFSLAGYTQNDTTIFTKQKEVATSDYVFYVPEGWKYLPGIDISSKDRKYELTGVGLPTEFKHFPVTATLTLRKYECPKITTAEDYIVTEFTSYPDRITPAGKNYETDTLTILSGEKATIYNTHYWRRSKVSNYSRYDLIVYSKKRKAAYMFTFTFQYIDPTYNFEKDNKLKQYALQFFSNILLR